MMTHQYFNFLVILVWNIFYFLAFLFTLTIKTRKINLGWKEREKYIDIPSQKLSSLNLFSSFNTYICDNFYYTETPNFQQQQNPRPSRTASNPWSMDKETNILYTELWRRPIIMCKIRQCTQKFMSYSIL